MVNKLPRFDLGKFINLVVITTLAFIGYRIYKSFSDPLGIKEDKSKKLASENFTTLSASEGLVLNETKANLSANNYKVSSLHLNIANSIYQKIDAFNVDEKGIINIINGIKSKETMQLVSVAYGQRKIPNWRLSHMFVSLSPWKDLFTGSDLYGSLTTHLRIVLNDDELRKIQTKLNWI